MGNVNFSERIVNTKKDSNWLQFQTDKQKNNKHLLLSVCSVSEWVRDSGLIVHELFEVLFDIMLFGILMILNDSRKIVYNFFFHRTIKLN